MESLALKRLDVGMRSIFRDTNVASMRIWMVKVGEIGLHVAIMGPIWANSGVGYQAFF